MEKSGEIECHILVIFSGNMPTVDLVMNLMMSFARDNNCQIRKKITDYVKADDILWADTILAIRPYDVGAIDIITAAKKNGKCVIAYLDDDLLNVPDLYASLPRMLIAKLLKRKNQKALKNCLSMCDVLWGSNPILLERYEEYVKSGMCVRCDVVADISQMKAVDVETEYPHILFAGGGDHAELLNRYIIPALNQIENKFPKLKMTCMGVNKIQLNECRVPIRFIPWNNNYEEYRKMIEKGNYHIGIAVIEEDEFFQCKYFNKFIEYSKLGAVGIYTDSAPYNLIVRHRENGFLAKSTVDSWAENIKYAIENPQLCIECVENAQKLIREDFNQEKLISKMIDVMPELCESHGIHEGKISYRQRLIWSLCKKMGMAVIEMYERCISKVG